MKMLVFQEWGGDQSTWKKALRARWKPTKNSTNKRNHPELKPGHIGERQVPTTTSLFPMTIEHRPFSCKDHSCPNRKQCLEKKNIKLLRTFNCHVKIHCCQCAIECVVSHTPGLVDFAIRITNFFTCQTKCLRKFKLWKYSTTKDDILRR